MPRLLRITTVPMSLHLLLQGQFRFMREQGFDVVTMSSQGREIEDVVRDGTRHIVIPLTRKITPLQDLKCLWLMVREIRQLKPDIVHTHTPKAGLIGMMAARICNVPVRLHTVAGLPLMEASGITRWVLQLAEQITYACAHRIYPNSVGLKLFIEQRFPMREEKVKIIGKGSSNGIDTVYFDRSNDLEERAVGVRAKCKIASADFVFSFVGRIVKDKGIVELIKAFKEVSDDLAKLHPKKKVFLLLVGPIEHDLDPLPQQIYDFAMEDERVIFAGFQADIRPWIMASDVFVFPSYREGFPNVVMQASLLKVPCIVSDINGCNEIVRDGITGIIVPPKKVDALVKSMKELILDDARRKGYGVAARNFVATHFKREFIWQELRKEYEERLQATRE